MRRRLTAQARTRGKRESRDVRRPVRDHVVVAEYERRSVVKKRAVRTAGKCVELAVHQQQHRGVASETEFAIRRAETDPRTATEGERGICRGPGVRENPVL